MRILIFNPVFASYRAPGACEQDRLANARILTRFGHTLHILTAAAPYQTPDEIRAFYASEGIEASVLPAARRGFSPARLRRLAFLDGAAWQYGTPDILRALDAAIASFRPDLIWIHGSYAWPVACRAKQRGLPTVIRSVNYEPLHFVQEHGLSPPNLARYAGKLLGERAALRYSDLVAAISPVDQGHYTALNSRLRIARVLLLPLRTLPALLRPPRPAADRAPLHVYFMGASYNVSHNRAALRFITEAVLPRIRQAAPGAFVFHILGGKAPADLAGQAAPDLRIDGYVPDLEAHLAGMDIALMPSLSGMGMQQKIFEALCRGFPTITHPRGLAGYSFAPDQAVLLADSAEAYVAALLRLRDPGLRARLAQGAARQAETLFAQSAIDAQMTAILGQVGQGG